MPYRINAFTGEFDLVEDVSALISSVDTDSGTATPVGGVLDILGGTGMNTSGAGNVVTVNLDSPVVVANGGSGRASATSYSVICGGTTSTDPHQSVVSVGTANQILTSNGAAALPTFQDGTSLDDLEFAGNDGSAFPSNDLLNLVGSGGINSAGGGNTLTFSLDSPVLLTRGGTGRTSSDAFAVICGGTTSTSAQQSVAGLGTAAQVLTSNGAGTLPTFQDAGGGGGGGSFEFVSTATASNDATIEFTDLDEAEVYKVVYIGLLPATDNSDIQIRMSNDNGSSFATIDYQYTTVYNVNTNWTGTTNKSASFVLTSNQSIGNQAGEFGGNGELTFYSTNVVAKPCMVLTRIGFQNGTGQNVHVVGVGISNDDGNGGGTLQINAIQIFMDSGNITSGTFHLYKLVTA